MMQDWTTAWGQLALTLSGSPQSPPHTTKNTSPMPRFFRSVTTDIGELRRLPTTVAGPQTEHVAAASQVDPDGCVERLVPDLAVSDFDVDRVDEDRRVDAQQRPRRPGLHVLSITRSVIRETVSLLRRGAVDLGEVPPRSAQCSAPWHTTEMTTASRSESLRCRFLTTAG